MTMYFSNFNGICAVKHKNNQIVAGLLFFHIIFGLAGILPLGSSLSASYAILENPIILILFLSFRPAACIVGGAIASHANRSCPVCSDSILMFGIRSATHNSGRFALTNAAGIGGHTALPHRRTCSLRGYVLPV